MGDRGMLVTVRTRIVALSITAALAVHATDARSQQTTAAATPATLTLSGPKVTEAAPDFALSGATRYGVLKAPVRLSDFRGTTVVLAFFFQARTKG